jgi:methyl-accepting chemotaxis protein
MIDKIGEIDQAATAIAAAVEQQSAATGEISRNASEASSGTQEVTNNIMGVQTASTQTSAATQTVREHADRLQGEAKGLTKAIDEIVEELRTA